MAENQLRIELRDGRGKGAARKLRATGRIPGVLYGRGRPTQTVSLDPTTLWRQIQQSEAGVNTLFDLVVEGNGELSGKVVLVKELQREPVGGGLLHADLYEVDLSQTVEVEVPVHLVGTPVGVSQEEGILDHQMREVQVECLPRAIPDELTLDVSGLHIGDSLHVRDLTLPEGVELREDPDLSVVSVVAPKKEEEPVVEAVEGVEGEVPAEGAPEGEAPAADAEKPEGDAGEAKED